MVKRYDVLSDDYRLNSRLDGAHLGLTCVLEKAAR
jgi:hypothetical protein